MDRMFQIDACASRSYVALFPRANEPASEAERSGAGDVFSPNASFSGHFRTIVRGAPWDESAYIDA